MSESMPQKKNGMRKSQKTQWTAQFLAAAELCRRGYVVTFTMGNCTQDYDLLVGSPNGKAFFVDVKGLSSNSDWLIRYKDLNPKMDMFYILVRVGEPGKEEDKFFIMSHADVNKELEAYYARRNTPVKEARMQGFSFKQASTHLNKWKNLPE